jgi:RNA polymerase sigma factor (TIGR02999 family)
MVTASERDITALLLQWRDGDQQALNQLTPLIYDKLRQMAARHLRAQRLPNTLQCTELVHEAYLTLIDQRRVKWQDRAHFFAITSRMIRLILVDHARRRNALKRGGGRTLLALDESIAPPDRTNVDLVALDEALERLSNLDQQQGRIVELRFFGGLSIEATAKFLAISPSTVKRDWNVARAWLYHELGRSTGYAG